ncbi:MAG: glutamate-1-semialdehyde 2,1-aminomutase [Eubacterium sp.]|nr:glutamate-1-semialdehyde 2,1-aminomutase [Eubacterium sp.]
MTTRSEQLFAEAKQYLPGGVNSPVRAFGSIGDIPRFIKKADAAFLWDEDGNRYIDYVGSWGPMLLGHNHPDILKSVVEACGRGLSYGAATAAEVEVAKLICEMVPSVEMVRMVNSGTEAVMSAVRTARGYTRRDKIIKFEGCYHGHSDGLLAKAGSGVLTNGIPDSAGVPKGCTQDTLLAPYNDLDSVRAYFEHAGDQIAAVLVEPVAANMGVVLPKPGFLEGLRSLCTQYGALLIFDEVITGFRLGVGGAQEAFGVTADLSAFGKVIGAGMPVGAYGGKRCIMEMVAPLGAVYQAGTLSGNPVAMAAGAAMLRLLKQNPHIYKTLNKNGNYFFEGLAKIVQRAGLPYQVNHIGSLGCLFFTDSKPTDYESARASDTKAYGAYCRYMLNHGIYLAPAQFEAVFLSAAHTKELLDETLETAEGYFAFAYCS